MTPDLSVTPATTALPASTGDKGIASGLAALLNSLKTSTLPPLRLDLLAGELKSLDLNTGIAATVFEALATADTKVTRSILVEVDKIIGELGLDNALLDSILLNLGLE